MSLTSRSIFVSVPHGTSAGNMLRAGGLLDRLQEFDAALRIVLFSPMARDAAFVREFERPGVVLLDQPPHVPSGLEARLLSLVQASFLSRGRTESVRIRMMEARANGIIRWIGLKSLLGRLVSPANAAYVLSDRLVSHPGMERLFDEHRPALVVCANPGLVFSEVPLMRTARRRGVPSMVIDASWDNFTNKLLPVRQADRLVVWNDIMKAQAVDLHGYRPDAVRVAGAPQFDPHFRPQARSTRTEFFQKIGADPARQLIVLTTTPRSLYRHHDYVLRELAAAIARGTLGGAQVLVRLHPRDEVDAYREFAGVPHVIIEKPFRSTVTVADGLAIDVMPEHQRHLGDTLCHADVVVNVASTITIEACIFDTPVVNICFDGPDVEPYERSATRYYKFTHYVNITRRNAVQVATSATGMVEAVARYLGDPSLDAEGRRQVVLDQCQFTDGHSAARVTAAVIDELGGSGDARRHPGWGPPDRLRQGSGASRRRTPQRGMRICHVAPELLPVPPIKGGAIERWIRDAAVRLSARGHAVHVISRDRGDGAREDAIDGVRYHYVTIPAWLDRGRPAALFRGLWYYLAVRRVLSRLPLDVVHHHSRPAGLWLSHPAGSRARLMISLHSMDYGWGFGYRAWDRPLFARGLAMAARVLCVSHFIERHTVERYPGLRASVTTVYNGVDCNLFRPQASGPKLPALTILYVGRVEARKGVKVLVDAFEQFISTRAPDARLRIVGPHSYWDAQPSGYYAAIKARCDANDRIELGGPTYVDTELAAVYRDAAVSVVPSTFPEALGLTSIEAQASGTPVVVSDAGGLPETVSPNESGLVFENGNVEQLANAVIALLESEPRRAAMADAARQWAVQKFSWDIIALELERIYADLGQDKPKGLSPQCKPNPGVHLS